MDLLWSLTARGNEFIKSAIVDVGIEFDYKEIVTSKSRKFFVKWKD